MNSEREAQREYYVLREMVAELETDIVKFAGGNNTAVTRIRKTMQDRIVWNFSPQFLLISTTSKPKDCFFYD